MLLKAAEEFNIDLSRSWMIGDGENDIKAGIAAGCSTALIGAEDYGQDKSVTSLLEIIETLLGAKTL
jgi:D-glycero-D-manno-heptose 1,7-bisphosphate phosphatase